MTSRGLPTSLESPKLQALGAPVTLEPPFVDSLWGIRR